MSSTPTIKRSTPPILCDNAHSEKHSVVDQDTILTGPTAPFDDPKDWSLRKKWLVTSVLSITGFSRIMISTIMTPALAAISAELKMSKIQSTLAFSIFLIAGAVGPLVMGPLSEIYGRLPVLHATSLWFLVWNLACGFANTGGLLIAARLMAGLGASAIYSLAGGVLGDVWRPEQRGISLSLYLLFPLLGSAVGPIFGGLIVDHMSWRWIFWCTSIVQAVMTVISIPTFKETCAPVLRRRAQRERSTGMELATAATIEEQTSELSSKLGTSLLRPMRMLLLHPIVQIMAILSAFEYGLLYLLLSTLSDTFMTVYHQSAATSGLHYFSLVIGELLGALLGGPLMDATYRTLRDRARGQASPEFRLPIMLPGVIFTPLGLLMYGWGAHYRVHWSVVDIGVLLAAFGLQVGSQGVQAYIIDTYPEHAGSASGALQLLRGLAAAGFPLFAPNMYQALGEGWGNTMLAIASFVVMAVVPVALWVFGPRLRARVE